MPNYNDNNTRDNSIDQLPRMIFQLPNTESGATSPSVNPVFFCQSGCAIDYNFSNIKSCQFNNDGKKFTITPTDTTNINYIMWNGKSEFLPIKVVLLMGCSHIIMRNMETLNRI